MIYETYLEADLLNHCNLSCEHCSVSTPFLKKRTYDLTQFKDDINRLSKVYQVHLFRFTGGEPLLVGNLSDFVDAVKRSGLARHVGVATNGLLLDRITPYLADRLDFINISAYTSIGQDRIERIKSRALSFQNATFEIKDSFGICDIGFRIGNPELVRQIWDSCTNRINCNCIADGYFYKCMQAYRKSLFLKAIGHVDANSFDPHLDGIDLKAPDLEERLTDYKRREMPLNACYYCLGTSGKFVPHAQRNADITSAFSEEPLSTEDLLNLLA